MGFRPISCLVRTTRTRIIRLRNDYKWLMQKCEEGLHALHASMRDVSPETISRFQPTPTASDPPRTSSSGSYEVPIGRVSNVMSGSPAEDAGLKAGDMIGNFGGVNWTSHEKLNKVAELVRKNEGVNIAYLPIEERVR